MEKGNDAAEFKARVVLEVLHEDESLNQIAAKCELNPQMVSQWKREFVEHVADVFDYKKNGESKLKKELAKKEDRYQRSSGR